MPPRTRTTKTEITRARAQAARQAAEHEQRRRRLTRIGLIAAAVALIAVVVSVVIVTRNNSTPATPPVTQPTASTSWGLPADASAAAANAGLPMLGQEMLEVHYHAHGDVIVRGQAVTVPAEIGIDDARKKISALHTHDATGVVHIESGKDIPFTLGQLFTEWGQPLTTSQVGPVTAASSEQVRV